MLVGTKLSKRRLVMAMLTAITAMGMATCAEVGPDPARVKKYLGIIIPEGPGKYPVVIFYQGTGGGDRRAYRWARWFEKRGVASAVVNNSGIRRRATLWGLDDYTADGAIAWDFLKDYPRIDTSRIALMGFSRGGRQVLMAGGVFGGKRAVPDFVFALYPGGGGTHTCAIDHEDSTKIHIFYGELDQSGKGPGGFFYACQGTAYYYDNVEFHELKGAHHGFDDRVAGSANIPGTSITFTMEPNPEALEETRAIIWRVLKEGWGLRNPQ